MKTKGRIFILLSFLACLFFCLACFHLTAPARAYAQFVENDEECVLENWEGAGVDVQTTEALYYSGSKALKITKSNLTAETYLSSASSARFAVQGGSVYEISAFVSSQSCDPESLLRLDLQLFSAQEDTTAHTTLQGYTYTLNAGAEPSAWKRIYTRMSIPEGEYYAGYRFRFIDGNAIVYIDTVEALLVEDATQTIVEKWNFRGPQTSERIGEWELDRSAPATLSRDAFGGRLTVTGSAGYAYLSRRLTSLQKGTIYELTGSYTSTGEESHSFAIVRFYDYYGNELRGYTRSVALKKSAAERSFSLLVKAPSNLYARLFIGSSGGAGSYGVKEVTVKAAVPYSVLDENSGWTFTTVKDYAVQREEAISGYAIKLEMGYSSGTNANNYIKKDASIGVIAGKEYILSYWVKIDEFSAGGKVDAFLLATEGVFVHTSGESKLNFFDEGNSVSSKGEWLYQERSFIPSASGRITQIGFKNYHNKSCTVYLDDIRLTVKSNITVEETPVQSVRLLKSDYTPQAARGERFSFDLELQLQNEGKTDYYPTATILDSKGKAVTQVRVETEKLPAEWQTGAPFYNEFFFTVPDFLAAGEYTVQLSEEQIRVEQDEGESNAVAQFTLTGEATGKTIVTVEKRAGLPTLLIDGKPTAPYMYSASSSPMCLIYDADDGMLESGVDLYATFQGSLAGESANVPLWREDGSLDYARFDRVIEDILETNGNAYLLVNISLYAPAWWKANNPNELGVNANGVSSNEASFASLQFRREAGERLRALVAHAKEQPYYSRLLGFKLSSGRTGEWMTEGNGLNNDFSVPARAEFIKWAQDRYGTVAAANGAWGTTYASFDEITFDEIKQTILDNPNGGITLDAATERQTIDYHLFLSDIVADSFLYYAGIVKEETAGEKLVGGYHGYSWYSASYGGNGTEHLSLERVLQSSNIDFVASPLAYSMRTIGQSSQFMVAQDTVQAYGKLYILEQDNRTAKSQGYDGGWNGADDYRIGRQHTFEGSAYELKRDFVNDFVNGNGSWYYDMFGGWFDDATLQALTRENRAEYEYSLCFENRQANAEVALFVSNSLYSYAANNPTVYSVYKYLLQTQKHRLSAMGAPYDVYKMDTLVSGEIPDHKVNIILAPYEISEAEAAAVQSKLQKNGQFVVWVCVGGLSGGSGASLTLMQGLTNFTLAETTAREYLQVKITGSTSIASGLTNTVYGNGSLLSVPKYYITESSGGTKLGILGGVSNHYGLGIREMTSGGKSWTSVYSAAPSLSVGLLRNILKEAGVHIYSQNDADIIYANENYVGLHSGVGGEKRVTLPRSYNVYDVYEKKLVAKNATEFSYLHTADDTKLFRLYLPTAYQLSFEGTEVTQSLQCGDTVAALPVPPSKAGYTSDGKWYLDGRELSVGESWQYLENKRATAKYIPNTYLLTLTGVSEPIRVTYGEEIGTLPAVPARLGMENDGKWYIEGSALTATSVWRYTEGQTAVGRYSAKGYLLRLEGIASPISVTYGEPIGALPSLPQRSGYTSDGKWYIGEREITAYSVWNYTEDQEATGSYTANRYSLSFEGLPMPITVSYGEPIGALPEIPATAGKTNDGKWYVGETVITSQTIWLYEENKRASGKYEDIYYAVTLPTGEGYEVVGENKVLYGDDYAFTVTVLEGYDEGSLIVKVNGSALVGEKGTYSLVGVTADVEVEISVRQVREESPSASEEEAGGCFSSVGGNLGGLLLAATIAVWARRRKNKRGAL